MMHVIDNLEVKKSLQAANAAWNMGNWEEMTMYVECLDTHEDALVQMPVLDTSGSGNGASDGAFFRAVLCVWKGKVWHALCYFSCPFTL
jgi:FKBP12-rapamycin complex-associated protein